ncbi:TIGR02281 family clan AA aspartic protease [Roseobacter sp. N2S]|uniref:retropepsin-like aspartic protease family protein n=1 Tax=Roseobacter sp. N2S TaxID=2663844 RepID=UPI0028667200|nr:TIGR02281 family clan AA aspartic protease [Roseobacter sp. N2S]MDR6265150.1 aspartyl protease family protein [Roseobacter sp. N2S]
MRWVYLAIAAFLGIIFLRADVQLVDLILNTNLKWSAVAAVFLVGLLVGQILRGFQPDGKTLKYAGWGLFVTLVLGVLEYSVEWQRDIVLANDQTLILTAASVESVSQHYITAKDGLFLTQASFNSAQADALIDTGASLVLVNYTTAKAAGVDVDALAFTIPVTTASGPLKIAQITLGEVRLGNSIVARNVPAAVTPKGLSHSNLLGGSFLLQMDQTVLRKDQMILSQRR